MQALWVVCIQADTLNSACPSQVSCHWLLGDYDTSTSLLYPPNSNRNASSCAVPVAVSSAFDKWDAVHFLRVAGSRQPAPYPVSVLPHSTFASEFAWITKSPTVPPLLSPPAD